MRDESSHDPARAYEETERDVLYLMTEPDHPQPIWSVDDLARAMEKPDILDYIGGLHRAGLIHKTSDGFVFATRSRTDGADGRSGGLTAEGGQRDPLLNDKSPAASRRRGSRSEIWAAAL